MLTISSDHTPIPAGRQGENAARQIRFDLREFSLSPSSPVSPSFSSPFLPENAVLSLLIRRPGEDAPYPVSLSFDETGGAGTALWTPSSADTALAGTGECELRLTSGDTLIKSRRYPFIIEASLGQETDPPPARQFWVDRVCGAAAAAENAAAALTASAEQIAQNTAGISVLSEDLSRKAAAGGLCEALTAGSALRLTDPDAEEMTWTPGTGSIPVPAGFRGKAFARVKTVLGRTCVKNQLYDPENGSTSTAGGVTYTNNGDGTWTLTGSGTSTNRKQLSGVSCIAGHVYYMSHGVPQDATGWYLCLTQSGSHLTGGSSADGYLFTAAYNFDAFSVRTSSIFRPPEEGLTLRPVLVDVTLLCGAGNEPSTAVELLARFPGIRGWSYDAGTLMHANISGLMSRGHEAAGGGDAAPEQTSVLSLPVSVYFPEGMMSAGVARDELREDRAIRRCTVENGAVIALDEPVITPISPPLSFTVSLYSEGTLEALAPDGMSSAPADFVIALTPDVISAVKALSREYASMNTLDELLETIGARLGISVSREWDENAGKWTFTAT